ncbi:FUSC family protein [Candidatus Clostridium stratigraminis]|uniref:FUSC family protein n=1 Tax=Candidatus Clostridium stratigraminis TaxID=3381661 RepID=A0ABW8T176_9CLOT
MQKLRAPGMRTIKTSLAVAICLIISKLLDLYYPYYAAISAILCIRSTVTDSFNAAKSRALGTIIGSLLGTFCVFIFPYNPWISGIGVLALIYFLKTINFEDAFIVALIVFLAIFMPNHGSSISYSLHRTTDTLIGILIALFLNLLLSPPEYAEDIHNQSNKLIDDLFICCGNFLIHNKEIELSTIAIGIMKLENLIKNYKMDVKKSRIKIINSHKFNLFIQDSKELYNHLGLINELSKLGYNCILNEENGDYIRDLYNHKLPFFKYEDTPYNEAFNYHVKELLKYLDNFRSLNLK